MYEYDSTKKKKLEDTMPVSALNSASNVKPNALVQDDHFSPDINSQKAPASLASSGIIRDGNSYSNKGGRSSLSATGRIGAGSVNTMSAENFMQDPKTSLALARKNEGLNSAGTGYSQQYKNDQQLIREGNRHLASTATAADKFKHERGELRDDLRMVNLSGDQSFGDLAASKAERRNIQMDLRDLNAGRDAEVSSISKSNAAEQDNFNKTEQLEQKFKNDMRLAQLKGRGGSDLKIGSTAESVQKALIDKGYDKLTKAQKFILLKEFRQKAIKELSAEKDEFGDPKKVTSDMVEDRMKLVVSSLGGSPMDIDQSDSQGIQPEGQFVDVGRQPEQGQVMNAGYQPEASQSIDQNMPSQAIDMLKSQGEGNPITFNNGQTWMIQNGRPVQVQ